MYIPIGLDVKEVVLSWSWELTYTQTYTHTTHTQLPGIYVGDEIILSSSRDTVGT